MKSCPSALNSKNFPLVLGGRILLPLKGNSDESLEIDLGYGSHRVCLFPRIVLPSCAYCSTGRGDHKLLTKQDLSVPDREGLMFEVELAPGAQEARHTHPGDLFAYVQEGTTTLHVQGQPPQTVRSREVFFVPAGKTHWGENREKTPVKLLVMYFIEKGKPLISPGDCNPHVELC